MVTTNENVAQNQQVGLVIDLFASVSHKRVNNEIMILQFVLSV